jgi:hypothetical protein
MTGRLRLTSHLVQVDWFKNVPYGTKCIGALFIKVATVQDLLITAAHGRPDEGAG